MKNVLLALTSFFTCCKAPSTPERMPASASAATTATQSAAESGAPLAVPATQTKIQCDGEANEEAWHTAARTGAFFDQSAKHDARPYSELRFLANKSELYLLFYAADENIIASDHFNLDLVNLQSPDVTYHFVLGPDGSLQSSRIAQGVASAWQSGLREGADMDGTFGDESDQDEEWVIEAALPLAAIGVKPGDTFGLAVDRCDTPKDGAQACGEWGRADDGNGVVGRVQLPSF